MLPLRRLVASAREGAAMAPVFIVGDARSGTSILYRTLQKHSAFAPREQNLVESELFALLRRAFLFRPPIPAPLVRFMLDDEAAYAEFVRSIRPARVTSALAAPVNAFVRDPPVWWWKATLAHLVARSYAAHAQRARGCDRLVEKTPTHWRHLDRIAAAFPRARLLHIHRHPVDVLSSYRRRAAVDPGGGWAAVGTQDFCRRYEETARRVLAWAGAHGDVLLLVRYEDLVERPVPTLQRICHHVGETFEAAMAEERDPKPHRWPVDPHLWGPLTARTKRWQDHLRPSDAAAVQRRLAVIMEQLGYDAYET